MEEKEESLEEFEKKMWEEAFEAAMYGPLSGALSLIEEMDAAMRENRPIKESYEHSLQYFLKLSRAVDTQNIIDYEHDFSQFRTTKTRQ